MSSSHRKQHAGARPADLEALRKRLARACERAEIIKDLNIRTFGGPSPGVLISDRAAPEHRVSVRSREELIDSLEQDDLVWQDKARTVARYLRESVRGTEPAERPKKKRREPEPEQRPRPRPSRSRDEQSDPEVEFQKYLHLDVPGPFGRRYGKFMVAAQAIGMLSPETLGASARNVITNGLGPFLDSNTGHSRGEISQAAIAFRAGCWRKVANLGLQRAIEIGILIASGPARRSRRYQLLAPADWPARLHEEIRARIIEAERLEREGREAHED
jgi:hypothetical protein